MEAPAGCRFFQPESLPLASPSPATDKKAEEEA
jgi:hypothetical protein